MIVSLTRTDGALVLFSALHVVTIEPIMIDGLEPATRIVLADAMPIDTFEELTEVAEAVQSALAPATLDFAGMIAALQAARE